MLRGWSSDIEAASVEGVRVPSASSMAKVGLAALYGVWSCQRYIRQWHSKRGKRTHGFQEADVDHAFIQEYDVRCMISVV